MTKLTYVKKSIITAVCIALCIVLPMAFHAIPNAGNIYCPMHIPVLLCGLICGWSFGLLCGIAAPIISSMLVQMPILAYLPGMVIELAAYGLISGVMMKFVHTKRVYADLYISLCVSIVLGRVVAGISQALIFAVGNYSVALWITGYFVTTWPGILIQLVLIPTIILALERSKLIPARYINS